MGRMTDACENITFPQLPLRAIITKSKLGVNCKWKSKLMFVVGLQMCCVSVFAWLVTTLGSTCNEFSYNEPRAFMSGFVGIKIIDCNGKKFGYNEHSLRTNSFFCIFLLAASGTQRNSKWKFASICC